MNLENMHLWAKYKGINVLGTGDFTHPFWVDQFKNELEDSGNGLYKLKNAKSDQKDIYFMLSCEISSIYSQGGQVRRIHNLFFFPKIESVEKFNEQLRKRNCNLRSDGRPIVGITSRDLAKIALDVDENAIIIPAHAWTPWFSIFGSFSGFDSIEECFGDMAPYIHAIETGLSSDPAMNWQIGDLNNRAIVSFSDAHSLEKMGREATVIEAEEISYKAIYKAFTGPVSTFPSTETLGHSLNRDQRSVINLHKGHRNQNSEITLSGAPSRSSKSRIAFTIEFHPEEGKYHFTGHRNCKVSQSPEESKERGDICPVCNRSLTVGVMHRVQELKSQNSTVKTEEVNGIKWMKSEEGRPPYVCLVPLLEILAESLGAGVSTKRVKDQYFSLINELGNEFSVLLKANLLDIARLAPGKVVEGIEKVRSGNIVVEPGYDGEYGIVKIWDKEEVIVEKENMEESQLNLFV